MEKIDGKGKKMRKSGKKEGTGQKEAHERKGGVARVLRGER